RRKDGGRLRHRATLPALRRARKCDQDSVGARAMPATGYAPGHGHALTCPALLHAAAAMPSFDIVSEVDTHELTNAVDQANRELSTRFDFKGVEASFERNDNL